MRATALIVVACLALGAMSPEAFAQQGQAPAQAALSVDATIGELLDNPASRAVLAEQLPDFVDDPRITPLRQMPLSQFQRLARPGAFPQAKLNAIAAGLAAAPARRGEVAASAEQLLATDNAGTEAAQGADATIGALLDNPETRAVLAREMPALTSAADVDRLRQVPLRALQQLSPQTFSSQTLSRVDAALDAEMGDAQ